MLFNGLLLTCRFLTQETVRYESRGRKFTPAAEEQQVNLSNVMDRWILSEAQHMVQASFTVLGFMNFGRLLVRW